MNAAPNRDKWVRQIRCDDSIATAAHVTLKTRLSTVADYLTLASQHSDETTEHVHQLRVSTRRSLAALQTYQCVLPANEAKWIRKRLNQIRKAAGEARDLDVFLQRYRKQSGSDHARFLRRLKKRRHKAQRPIVDLHKKLISKHQFDRHVDLLLNNITLDSSSPEQPLAVWAVSSIADVSQRFFKVAPAGTMPTRKELHRFRIRGKELRYVLELFSAILPAELLRPLYRQVTRLQDRLGQLCDHASARRQLKDWRHQTSAAKAKYLHSLERKEGAALARSIAKFAKWWTPVRSSQLQTSIHRITTIHRITGAEPVSGERSSL